MSKFFNTVISLLRECAPLDKFFNIVMWLLFAFIVSVVMVIVLIILNEVGPYEQPENSMDILGWIIVFFFAWPIIHVLFSGRSTGGATFAWFVFTLCFSWISYLIFLIVTQSNITKKKIEVYQPKTEG